MQQRSAVALRIQSAFGARRLNPLALSTYFTAVAGLVAALAIVDRHPLLALLIAAMLCGCSELDGYCGTSHIAALTPLRAFRDKPRLWIKAVAAYTAGGLITAACVGAIVGLVPIADWKYVAPVIAVLAALLLAREVGWVHFELPQVHRQTNKMWAFDFGFVTAAWMWGSHIGIGFATVIKHGGFFVLACVAAASASTEGAIIFASYWLGRSLPMWLAPAMGSNCTDGGAMAQLVHTSTAAYRFIAGAGIICATAYALVLAYDPSLAPGWR